MSPKTVLSSAPPGARTLDTLIKRKGFQSLFLLRFFAPFWRFTRLEPCDIIGMLLTLSSRKEVPFWIYLLPF